MFGWTALLLRADRAPVERRDLLLSTLCPVIVGLTLSEAATVAAGLLAVGFTAAIWALQLGLGALFLGSWRRASPAVQSAARRLGSR